VSQDSSSKQAALDALIAHTVRDDVRAQHGYVVGDARGLIKLDAMENPFMLPPALMQLLGERLSKVAINRYPDSRANQLRELLAKRYRLAAHQDVLLGNGSDELISIMVTACARSEAAVLTLGPGFAMYRMTCEFARVPYVEVPLTQDFEIDLGATLAAISTHRPSIIFIAYPNNPTGTLFRRADIEAIAAASDALLVIDEAYEAFSPDSFLNAMADAPRLVVLRTLSKVGLAGIRLGYLMGERALLAEFDKVRPPYNINSLTQCAAAFALQHSDVLTAQAEVLKSEREELCRALAVRPAVKVFPSAANFVLFRLLSDRQEAAKEVFAGIRQHGVLIKNVSQAHPLLHNCLRVTVSSPEENRAFLDAFDRVWPNAVSPAGPRNV
jgi:histidinol-phosphate aminotransferase